jgi:hypothetical protein
LDYEKPTPAGVIRGTWNWFGAALTVGFAGILLVTILSLFVWHIGGVFQQKSIQRSYSNTVDSQAYQQSLLAEMEQHVTNITGPGGLAATRTSIPANSPEQATVRASELNEITLFCSESANFQPGVAPGSQQMQAIVAANCTAGSPVADPPLADPVLAGGQ